MISFAKAVILKGCALRAIDEQSDAIAHFKEASRLEPTRYIHVFHTDC